MLVAEGVYKVERTRVGNAYLAHSTEGLILVDTGIGAGADGVVELTRTVGRRSSDLRYLVLTHWHPDHVGNAAELRRLTGATIAIHELDAPVLAGRERPAKGRRTMGLLLRALRIHPVIADVVLRGRCPPGRSARKTEATRSKVEPRREPGDAVRSGLDGARAYARAAWSWSPDQGAGSVNVRGT